MNLIDFIRIILKNIALLLASPILLALLVIYLTQNPNFKYASETTLFTGIATGSGVEMEKSFNFFMNNVAYDNLISIIKSRNTQNEVGIRLLAQHLLLDKPNPKYISEKSLSRIKNIAPKYIYNYIVTELKTVNHEIIDKLITVSDTLKEEESFRFVDQDNTGFHSGCPEGISEEAFEQTVKNLTDLMVSNDTNFVYELLNYPNTYYSVSALSKIQVRRISGSDLVLLKFETDDPGICQQTLFILNSVCIKNYKVIKGNRSDEVVKYFEYQTRLATNRLNAAEDKLLEFNKLNKIINYYEQSKAVAVVKEDLDVAYNNMRIKLAGIEAAITRLEEKLQLQGQIQQKSQKIIDKKDVLGSLSYQIAIDESIKPDHNQSPTNLEKLKRESEQLQQEIKTDVNELYSYQNSTEGLPLNTLLNEWLSNIVEAENLKAGLDVFGKRIEEFQDQYSIYAPAGATVKRLEREISVAEREYLSILYGLNLAKLKMQDNELASIIKVIDAPFYPLSPMPTKRKVMVIASAFMGFVLVLALILALEFFDQTLKNPEIATKKLTLACAGIVPKAYLNTNGINFPFVINRLLEKILQNIEINDLKRLSNPRSKIIVIYSTLSNDGKTVVLCNLVNNLIRQGKNAIALSYEPDSLNFFSNNQTNINDIPLPSSIKKNRKNKNFLFSWTRMLGYPDVRIDYNNPVLDPPDKILPENSFFYYKVDATYLQTDGFESLLKKNNIIPEIEPDYIFIEIPPIVYYPFPAALISQADKHLMVCRANRVWGNADRLAYNVFEKATQQKGCFVLNGVELSVVESVLGDLQKKRSWFRRKVKNIFRFHFLTKNEL
jgi:polysaccharide biosynthesis transport protein